MVRRGIVLVAVMALVVHLASGLSFAAKQKVTLWSFAPNNIVEWRALEPSVEGKFGIDLEIVEVAQNAFVETLQAAMMDGSGYPDIIEWMIENNRILNADPKNCMVIPIDKYVSNSSVFSKVPQGRVAWVTYGGHVYGLPHDVHPAVLVYNDTLWKSVGVDMEKIQTWDEFFEAAQKLAAEKKDGRPVHYALPYMPDGFNGSMFMIWQQAGCQILDKDGKPAFDSPEFKAFLQKWIDWINLGVMSAWDWGNFASQLENGTLASYTCPDWYLSQVNNASAKYTFKARPLPLYNAESPRTASWGGSFMAITRLAKNPDLLYQIIEFMQYDESTLTTRFEQTDMIAPFAEVWDDPVFHRPDPRFGGQMIGELLTTLAKEMPPVNSGDIFWDAIFTDFNTVFPQIVSGSVSVEKGLVDVQQAALRRYERLKK